MAALVAAWIAMAISPKPFYLKFVLEYSWYPLVALGLHRAPVIAPYIFVTFMWLTWALAFVVLPVLYIVFVPGRLGRALVRCGASDRAAALLGWLLGIILLVLLVGVLQSSEPVKWDLI